MVHDFPSPTGWTRRLGSRRIHIRQRFLRQETGEDHHRLHLSQPSQFRIQRRNCHRLEPQRSSSQRLGLQWIQQQLPNFTSNCLIEEHRTIKLIC